MVFYQRITRRGMVAHPLETTGPDSTVAQFQVADSAGGKNLRSAFLARLPHDSIPLLAVFYITDLTIKKKNKYVFHYTLFLRED